MDKKYGQIAEMVHFLIEGSYCGIEGLNFVDLTCGNGYDTLFLSNLAGDSGHVTAFDIQDTAIERTNKLMQESSKFNNYKIINDGHEFVGKYIMEKIDAAVFNLGYLPQHSKEVFTKPDTTILSLNSLIPLLKDSGRIYIATYISHDKGDEISKIMDYLNNLNRNKYNVLHIKLINKNNTPPELFIIENNAR